MAFAPALAEDSVKKNGTAAMATRVWLAGLAVLLVPSLAAWLVRGLGYALSCAPNEAACLGTPFDGIMGSALKGTLDLAWLVSTDVALTLAIALAASLAAIVALRPVSAALTMLIAPLAALLLPTFLVSVTTYDGCAVNADGLGDCKVWGESMGMAFHNAASAPQLIYTYTPIVVAGALVAGLLGWIVQWGTRQMKKS
jgi:hypothetical protein